MVPPSCRGKCMDLKHGMLLRACGGFWGERTMKKFSFYSLGQASTPTQLGLSPELTKPSYSKNKKDLLNPGPAHNPSPQTLRAHTFKSTLFFFIIIIKSWNTVISDPKCPKTSKRKRTYWHLTYFWISQVSSRTILDNLNALRTHRPKLW